MIDFEYEIIDIDKDNITVKFFSSALETPITVMLPRKNYCGEDSIVGLNLVTMGHYE